MHTTLHLTAERLAALADDAPSSVEQAHLDACPACCRERESHRALVAMAAVERTRIAPPVSAWEAIAAGLRADGVLGDAPVTASPLALVTGDRAAPSRQTRGTHVTLRVPRWAMQAAAAVALVAGGVLAGRLTSGDLGSERLAALSGRQPGADRGTATATTPGAIPVGNAVGNAAAFRTRDDAVAALEAAAHQYQRASEYLAQSDSSAAPASDAPTADVYRARLAAFDGVVAATQEALYAAPADPVINRYYLATNAARETAIRQLNLVSAAGVQINRY